MEPQGDGVTGKEHLTILWNEYKDQRDWQRHNETQRAQLTNLLLVISAALIAFSRDGGGKSFVPWFLVGIGCFGLVAVGKYWERFVWHGWQADACCKAMTAYFPKVDDSKPDSKQNLLILANQSGTDRHIKDRSQPGYSRWWRCLMKDSCLQQHKLWYFLFIFIAFVGLFMGICPSKP
jgi:hypothetical protein